MPALVRLRSRDVVGVRQEAGGRHSDWGWRGRPTGDRHRGDGSSFVFHEIFVLD